MFYFQQKSQNPRCQSVPYFQGRCQTTYKIIANEFLNHGLWDMVFLFLDSPLPQKTWDWKRILRAYANQTSLLRGQKEYFSNISSLARKKHLPIAPLEGAWYGFPEDWGHSGLVSHSQPETRRCQWQPNEWERSLSRETEEAHSSLFV